MRVLSAFLLVVLVLLQYRLWLSDEGIREVWQLSSAVDAQRKENDDLSERNRQLKAEVVDLKQGLTALEERARHDLGMVGSNESFYQVVDPSQLPRAPTPPPTTTTAATTR